MPGLLAALGELPRERFLPEAAALGRLRRRRRAAGQRPFHDGADGAGPPDPDPAAAARGQGDGRGRRTGLRRRDPGAAGQVGGCRRGRRRTWRPAPSRRCANSASSGVQQVAGQAEQGAAASGPYDVILIEGAVHEVPQGDRRPARRGRPAGHGHRRPERRTGRRASLREAGRYRCRAGRFSTPVRRRCRVLPAPRDSPSRRVRHFAMLEGYQ